MIYITCNQSWNSKCLAGINEDTINSYLHKFPVGVFCSGYDHDRCSVLFSGFPNYLISWFGLTAVRRKSERYRRERIIWSLFYYQNQFVYIISLYLYLYIIWTRQLHVDDQARDSLAFDIFPPCVSTNLTYIPSFSLGWKHQEYSLDSHLNSGHPRPTLCLRIVWSLVT